MQYRVRESPHSLLLIALPYGCGLVVLWLALTTPAPVVRLWPLGFVLLWASLLAAILVKADTDRALRQDTGLVLPVSRNAWALLMLAFWPVLLFWHFRARSIAGYASRTPSLAVGVVVLLGSWMVLASKVREEGRVLRQKQFFDMVARRGPGKYWTPDGKHQVTLRGPQILNSNSATGPVPPTPTPTVAMPSDTTNPLQAFPPPFPSLKNGGGQVPKVGTP